MEELNLLSEKNVKSETRLKSKSPKLRESNQSGSIGETNTSKSSKNDEVNKERRSPKNAAKKMSPFHQNMPKKTLLFKKPTISES